MTTAGDPIVFVIHQDLGRETMKGAPAAGMDSIIGATL
jgi:hypothetical protein